jgi:hypothetical protein
VTGITLMNHTRARAPVAPSPHEPQPNHNVLPPLVDHPIEDFFLPMQAEFALSIHGEPIRRTYIEGIHDNANRF